MAANDDPIIVQTGRPHLDCSLHAKRLGAILCMAVVLILAFATRFSPAQTTMELIRWREFSYARRTSQVGGQIAGLHTTERGGFIVLNDGTFARVSGTFVHSDSPEGRIFYQGFVMYDFKDGSSILAKVDVSGDPVGKQVGTITFLAGTQRFKGITGRGTVSSSMPAEWDLYAEIEASYSVAGK
ncbi:MAG: hypothetical protein A2Y77_15360 [Planctomycetes bacterium RBG_13_62_9]|nr:MAG: hypothetical protein A2Y77_15360 [Planctomycetes bacterium RBG_13_62_9]